MVRTIAVLIGFLVVMRAPGIAESHPLHSSFTEITRDRTGVISLSVRLFADDFGAVLDSLRGLPASRRGAADSEARHYFEKSVKLVSKDGAAVPLVWCGMRTESNLTWLCARTMGPVPRGALRLRNAMMFDRFADQISIVRWTVQSRVRTLVLTGSVPEAILDQGR